MKKSELKKILGEKCKDFGLTEKAIDDLSELGSANITEETTTEELTKVVDLLAPFAKAMQAEVTRKTRKTPSAQPTMQNSAVLSNGEGTANGANESNEGVGSSMPEWFKPFSQKLEALEKENASLKNEKAKTEKANSITAKAKNLGIPDYLMKRVSFEDGADIDKELEAYKQELVTNNLMPKQALDKGTVEDQMKAEAKQWAQSLPTL